MNRLLSRREKDGPSHRRQKSRDNPDKKDPDRKIRPLSNEINRLFKYDPQRKLDKDQDVKIQLMRERLTNDGFSDIGDQQLQYGLFSKHANGDVDKAVELVKLFQESVEGVIKKYDSTVEMLGAVNNQGVTCWLDSLLFAMFAQLPSFEPILYTIYDDEPKRRLSTLLRLWVNMMRTGILIQTDVTRYIQEAIAECGWKEGGDIEQQDVSEAFAFITNTLQLPLLTLKVDLYHDGVADAKDDHKRVYERLLEVAIPSKPEDGQIITLERCLEDYFNNKVEVRRMLERSHSSKLERSNTTSSMDSEKEATTRVEVAELSSPNTPISNHPPATPLTQTRIRAQSIIRRRLIDDEQGESSTTDPDNTSTRGSVRKQSLRNEVMMPAWQFFNLIRPLPFQSNLPIFTVSSPSQHHVLIGGLAWYTKSTIPNDASLAAHFSQARPVLVICLKRYSMDKNGELIKNSNYVDIPLEVQFPHFVQDETIDEEGPSLGNFKLSLQSVICHRGESVHRGHYFSYIRASEISDGDSASDRRLSSSSLPPNYPLDRWITHNDLATPRVDYVDINKVLKEETPYLLFYQVQPIFDEVSQAASTTDPTVKPPSYDSGIDIKFTESSPQVYGNPFPAPLRRQEEQKQQGQQGYFDGVREDTTKSAAPSIRLSAEIERQGQSMTLPEDRRGSVAFTDTSIGSARSLSALEIASAPATPNEESTVQRLSRAASRFRKSGSKSRPTSSSGENRIAENRISATFSRLAARSKEQLNKMDISSNKDIPSIPSTDGAVDSPEAVPVVKKEEVALKPADAAPTRKASKRGRKQEKLEKSKGHDKEKEEHHHQNKKDKWNEPVFRNGKQVPERECMIM